MKCLIIVHRYQRSSGETHEGGQKNFNYAFPIGFGYIAGVLKKNNHEVSVLNLNHHDGLVDDLIRNEMSSNKHDIMITGGLSPFYPNIKIIVDSVRKHAQNVTIILGGGIISSQPEVAFGLLKPDFGVIGEGELTVAELLECIEKRNDVSGVNGIVYRTPENEIKITNTRAPIRDLDALPWPDYECLGFEEFLDHMYPSNTAYYDIFDNPRVYPMVSSRSCPYACTFCFHPLGNKYRQRSVENIIEEMKYVVLRYRINIVEFYDELFAHDRKRVSTLCRSISEFAATLPWELKWVCAMRVDCLDEDVISEMKNAGCYFFSLGLESFSAEVLKSMKKKITPEQIDNALRLCKRLGMSVQGNFIFGDIAETTKTYHETLDYWKNHRDLCEANIGLTHIVIYQGSYIYRYALQKGIIRNEIQFIEERAKKTDFYFDPVNFTAGMNDREYHQMIADYREALSVSRYYAIPIRNTQTTETHEIEVKCPFCNKVSVYKNYYLPDDFERINICCRHCRSRYIVASEKLRMKFLVVRIFGFRITYSLAKTLYDFSEHLPIPARNKIRKMLAG